MSTEVCRHCRFGIPSDATICPGCGRRHEPRRLATDVPAHSRLLVLARWSRRLLVVTGWSAMAFGVVAVARYVVGLDRVAVQVSVDLPGRLAHDARLLGLGTLLLVGLTACALAAWAHRAHRNLRALDLEPSLVSPWGFPGWLVPGRAARRRKLGVDRAWRDRSPLLAALPAASGRSRRPVSSVVLRWWALWLWVPAAITLVVIVADSGADGSPTLGGVVPLAGVAAAALLVASARSIYDVVGIITTAQAHRAEGVRRLRADLPWDDAPAAEQQLPVAG